MCAGNPYEFMEYMEYCRSLSFEAEPDYRKCCKIFENCMLRHEYDARVLDFTWKQNRLSKDKEALKAAMLGVIRKKPKREERGGAQNVGDSKAAGGVQPDL